MLDICFLIVLSVLGVRAFVALRHESQVCSEFGQSSRLGWIALLYPLGPIIVLIGRYFVSPYIVLLVVAAFYAYALMLASRQKDALESSGTDRVKSALSATSSASLGALVGLIYLAIAAIYLLFARYI